MQGIRWTVVAWAALVLSACGGGGGGGGGDAGSGGSEALAQREQPLQLDAGNRFTVLQVGMVYAESLLALAHDVGTWVHDASPVPGQSVSCGGQGARQVQLNDLDGNGRLSAGDRLTLQLDRCRAAASDNVFTGRIVVQVNALPAQGGWAGRLEFPDAGLAFQAGGVGFSWRGALNASVWVGTGSPVLRRLALDSAAAASLELLAQVNGNSSREVITDLRLRHDVTLQQAGARTSIDLRLASDVLRGSVRLQTPEVLASYFDTYAHEGRFRLQGASGDAIELAAADGRQAGWLTAWVDGVQQAGTPAGLLWRQVSAGYLWWGEGNAPQAYAATRELQEGAFSATVVSGGALDAGASEVLLLFNRSPAPGTRPVAWLQHDGSIGGGPYFGPSRIDTVATLTGAALALRPVQPLAPGQQYTLYAVNQLPSGEFDALRDGRGGALNGLAGSWPVRTALTALAAMRPSADSVVLPGRPVTLEAQPATQARAYQWRQVAGPPLILSSDTGLQTSVSLPAGAVGDVADAVLELAVVSDAGAVDRVRRTIKVVPSAASTTLLRVLAGPGAGPGRNLYTQASAFGHWQPGLGAIGLTLSLPFEPTLMSVQLSFFMLPGQPLAPGRYTIVPSAFGVPRAGPDVTTMWGIDTCLSGMSGSFTIHEVAISSERQFDGFPLQRLAVDFDISCNGGPPVSGSLRFFSSVPVREGPAGS